MKRLPLILLALTLVACSSDDDKPESYNNDEPWRRDARFADVDAADTAAEDGDGGGSDADADTGGQPGRLVETTEGSVVGHAHAGVQRFLGIPYAAPPVGERRWAPPADPAPFDATFVADEWGYACPQQANQLNDAGPTDEDCLTLNVWTASPDATEPRPVMVWIHGGGFLQGSARQTVGNTHSYEASDLAAEGVVVVTLNYRLGQLGFLAHAAFSPTDAEPPQAGNWGLMDQVRALEWVRDNIAGFGGDPDNVTIFGESAGAVSVCALMASPWADGLFDRAIMESGSCLEEMATLQDGFDQGDRYAQAIGCADAADPAACLRAKPVNEVLNTLPGTIALQGGDGERYEPIVDGVVLTSTLQEAIASGAAAEVPLVAGVNADEGTLFASPYRQMTRIQYENAVRATFPNIADEVLAQYPAADYDRPWLALAAIMGDIGFTCPTRRTMRAHTAAGRDAYTYAFTHVTTVGEQYGLGSFHASEVGFVFGNQGGMSADEQALSDAMQTWWTSFATAGAPGQAAGVEWPNYDPSADEGVELDAGNLGTIAGFRAGYCDFWDQFVP